VSTRLFLILNGTDVRAPHVDEGERFVVAIAAGELDVEKIAATLAEWAPPAR
jgi:death-on-curing protein